MEEKDKIVSQLDDHLCKLDIGGQTGVLFDLEQLKHKSTREHVENPARLQSIFQHLTSEQLLKSPCVNVVSKLNPASREIIGYVHDENYLEFIDGMWPEKTDKNEIYILDTYFNNSSQYAAQIGVGAVIEAIDRVKKEEWKNAFCIVRPPGHHSGEAKVCTGFCFYNNVAIGARYLQKHHGVKKVLIFDWDVHHGDGTQHIFEEDPSVLLVSLHRHDDGSFYPKSGSVANCGKGAGKGFSVNIPWDVGYSENAVTAGTDEYIFAFERVALPIIKEFSPEFIIISAGFDSAEGDPLGQCKLTYDGYAYLTRRLMEVTGGKNIMAVLEGGYNLESISWAAESVLRTLIGEKIPLEKSKLKKNLKEMKDKAQPNVVGFNAVRKCLTQYQPFWPSLESFGTEYDKQMIQNVGGSSQISAGHELNFIIKEGTIFKHCKINELLFYKELNNSESKHFAENQLLKRFTPELKGFETINGREYVALENLTFGRESGSIIDFKLGRSTIHASYGEDKTKVIEKKDLKSTSSTLGFRLSGAFIKDDIGIPSEVVKKGSFLTSLKQKDLIEYTQKLFSSNKQELNMKPLNDFITFIEELLSFFETQNTRSFISTSIIAIVDNISRSYVFRLIDFNYVEDLPNDVKHDENVIFGIKNLLDMCKKIKASPNELNKIK